METTNPFQFLFQAFFWLLQLGQTIWDFLFMDIQLGDNHFQLWTILGGGIIVALLVLKLIKDFVPLA